MLNLLKTHRKWLVPTGVATVLISLLFSFTLHLQHRKQEERNGPADVENSKKRAAQTDSQDMPRDTPKQIPGLPAKMIPEDKISGFSREPAPDELTRKLEVMDEQERKTEEKKFAELRIVWPLYFFKIMKHGQDTATVMLDASEDGFGVIVVTEINLQRYPDIAASQPGDKIWIAGQIGEVDTHGTGQIVLIPKYVGFADGKGEKSGTGSQNSGDKPEKLTY
jgi:hypothetical protein